MLVVTAPVFVSATVAACGTRAAFESKRLSAKDAGAPYACSLEAFVAPPLVSRGKRRRAL